MTRDIQLSQDNQPNDIMLAQEVDRYRLIKREAYADLYTRGDLAALVRAMSAPQRFRFTADCLQSALRYQTQRGLPQDRDEGQLINHLRGYADGNISQHRLIHQWQKCPLSFSPRHLKGSASGLWAANSSADWLCYKAAQWGRGEHERQWCLERALYHLTGLEQ